MIGNRSMGIFMTESSSEWASTPKTATSGTAKAISGHRLYSPEIGRWASPWDEHSQRLLFPFIGRHVQRLDQQTSILLRYVFAGNDAIPRNASVLHSLPDRAFGALADIVIVIPSDDDGHVLCKSCDEKPVITGCDKWEPILQAACRAHEQKHIDQAPSTWCQWKTVTRDLGNGVGVTESCCPDKGHYLDPGDIGKPRWPDLECPAHAAGIEVMAKQLDGVLSDKDRISLSERIKDECALMAAKGCRDVPSVCGKK
jgi:hypothetical protein